MGTRRDPSICQKKENFSLFSDLSIDITVNILTRLPIKTILAAGKLVCKEWRDIIRSDPIFAQTHHQISRFSLITSKSMFVFEGFKKTVNTNGDCYHTLESSKLGQRQDLSQSQSQVGFRALNSCRGFLFLEISYDDGRYRRYIYNPLTNEKVSIPRMNVAVPSKSECCGLGFNTRTKQYKAVIFIREPTETYRIFIYIISNKFPRNYAWREVTLKEGYSNIINKILWDETNKPRELNGALHCKAAEESILCFDMDNEKPSLMTSPCAKDSGMYVISIEVFRGLLCLGIKSSSNSWLEMWVMKDYRMSESWMKYVVVKQQVLGLPKLNLDRAILVDVLDTGEIIILCHFHTYRLLSYNPIKEIFTSFSIPHYRSNLWAEVYIPSFFSIDNL